MSKPTIAIIGGTGDEGSGLALRWAAAGYPIIIGSRSRERAENAAMELSEQLPSHSGSISGEENAAAAAAAALVVLSVPYESQATILEQIQQGCQNKTLITVVAPTQSPKSHVWHPPGGSAALEAQSQLGDNVTVVAAFQNVGAGELKNLDHTLDCDILITGDDKQAKQTAIELAKAAGLYGLDAGPLINSSVVEGLTAVLIGINIRHKVRGAGVRITNIPRA